MYSSDVSVVSFDVRSTAMNFFLQQPPNYPRPLRLVINLESVREMGGDIDARVLPSPPYMSGTGVSTNACHTDCNIVVRLSKLHQDVRIEHRQTKA